jgi:hypothetical protein
VAPFVQNASRREEDLDAGLHRCPVGTGRGTSRYRPLLRSFMFWLP